MLRSSVLEKSLFLFCLALFAGFLVWAVATEPPTGSMVGGIASLTADEESDEDQDDGRVWSEKAYRSRTILLGAYSAQPAPPESSSTGLQSLTSGLMFSGGTESTQWFEVSLVTFNTDARRRKYEIFID